jgi:hypothetical protein
MAVRYLLSLTVVALAMASCAPKGGNLGRRVNAPTPGGLVDQKLPLAPAVAHPGLPAR